MLDGYLFTVEEKRSFHNEQLFLARKTVTAIVNIIESFGKGSLTDELDVFPIPEYDKMIKRARKKEKEDFEKRAVKALEKYRSIERRLKGE